MKPKMTVGILATLLAGPVFASDKQIDVSVKGMVCSFCAQGIKKKFSADEAVEGIDVSLEKHRVGLVLKDGKDIGDEKITEILKEAGFSVENIERK